MTYKITLELSILAVKTQGGYADTMDLYVETTEVLTAQLIRDALAKMILLRESEPERWSTSLQLMATLQLMLDLHFTEPEDNKKEFNIGKGYNGVSNEFPNINITVIELVIIELHGESHDNT